MLQKFKITTCAFILFLFGLTLMTVSPVKAEDEEYVKCVNTGKKKGAKYPYKNRMNCFRDLIDDMILQSDVMTPANANMILDFGNVDEAWITQCTHISKTKGAKFPYKKRTNCYEQLADDLEHGYTCHTNQYDRYIKGKKREERTWFYVIRDGTKNVTSCYIQQKYCTNESAGYSSLLEGGLEDACINEVRTARRLERD